MALCQAPVGGLTIPELMHFTGMGRTWIYDRLLSHANAGRAQQVSRGHWRAIDEHRTRIDTSEPRPAAAEPTPRRATTAIHTDGGTVTASVDVLMSQAVADILWRIIECAAKNR